MECFHTKHSTAMTRALPAKSRTLVILLVTGGSDCHGMSKGKPLIGTIKLPYAHVEAMKNKLPKRAASPWIPVASGVADLPLRLRKS